MSDISKIEKLYSRFAVDFLGEIKSDEFYAYFDNMLRSGTANIALSEKYVERRIDLRWVEAIEQTIIPLDNIIRDPNRYIKNIEEIVPIEMARGISTEAVRHLATHTNMIAKVENGNVTPQKILNIVKEESFDTYENRFIYTLLFKLEYFLDKRLQTLMSGSKVADKYEIKMDGSCSAGHDEISYAFSMNYSTPHVEVSGEELAVGADVSNLTSLQRIERLRKILYTFKESVLIKSLKDCAMVRPPLTMTNVLTKNQNFRRCVDLWGFIERYEEVGFDVNVVERTTEPSEQYISNLFAMAALQYVVMKKNVSYKTEDIGDYAERRAQTSPNVKTSIEEIIDSYDLEIDEIRRIFLTEIDRKKKKRQAEFAKVRDILKRAIDTDTEYIAKQNQTRAKRLEREAIRAQKEREKFEREERKRLEQERIAREEAERAARKEAERAAREEAERIAREEAERIAREEAERAAREEAERIAREEAERIAREEAERVAREEAERIACEEAERAAREEAERIAREEAERKATAEGSTVDAKKKSFLASVLVKKRNKSKPKEERVGVADTVTETVDADRPSVVTEQARVQFANLDEITQNNGIKVQAKQQPPKPQKHVYDGSRKKNRKKAREKRKQMKSSVTK